MTFLERFPRPIVDDMFPVQPMDLSRVPIQAQEVGRPFRSAKESQRYLSIDSGLAVSGLYSIIRQPKPQSGNRRGKRG